MKKRPRKPLFPALADLARAAAPVVVACGGDEHDAERIAHAIERANDVVGPIAVGAAETVRRFRGAR